MRFGQRLDLALVIVGVSARVERAKLGQRNVGAQGLDALQRLFAELDGGTQIAPRARRLGASLSASACLSRTRPNRRPRVQSRSTHRPLAPAQDRGRHSPARAPHWLSCWPACRHSPGRHCPPRSRRRTVAALRGLGRRTLGGRLDPAPRSCSRQTAGANRGPGHTRLADRRQSRGPPSRRSARVRHQAIFRALGGGIRRRARARLAPGTSSPVPGKRERLEVELIQRRVDLHGFG